MSIEYQITIFSPNYKYKYIIKKLIQTCLKLLYFALRHFKDFKRNRYSQADWNRTDTKAQLIHSNT